MTYIPKDHMFAKVVLASRSKYSPDILTIHMRYPRIIHGEIMTHRVFSRNARSSRAVPVKTMLAEIRDTPFIPWHWGLNQGGMQASEECNELVSLPSYPFTDSEVGVSREAMWEFAANAAADTAEAFSAAGYHKQVANRLIEPFSWIDTLITSTSWANFFHLRDHDAAEPHFRDLAKLVRSAISGAMLTRLQAGEWHLPYITDEDRIEVHMIYKDCAPSVEKEKAKLDKLLRISAARCARISYAPFDGDASIKKELARYDMLIGSDAVHATPTEHQATPDWAVICPTSGSVEGWDTPNLHGNFNGWIQARKLIPGEFVSG